MAETIYNYNQDQFPDAKVNPDTLKAEIQASSIVTALERIDTAGGSITDGQISGTFTVDVVFKDSLSPGDKTTLDDDAEDPAGGLIAAHDNSPLTVSKPQAVEVQGQPRVHSTPRPKDMSTYFTSASDHPTNGVGEGDALLCFKLAVGDTHKSRDVTFLEDVLIKDGFVVVEGAPLGAAISAEAYTPDGLTKVGAFVHRAAVLGSMFVPFDTDDYGVLPAGFRLRVTVWNSEGALIDADLDAPAAFTAIARIEMYRETTVGLPT